MKFTYIKKELFLNIKSNIILHLFVDDKGNILGKDKFDDFKYCMRIKLISKLRRV